MLRLAVVRHDSNGAEAGSKADLDDDIQKLYESKCKKRDDSVAVVAQQHNPAQLYSDLLAAIIRTDKAAGTQHMVSASSQQPAVSAAAVELAMRGSLSIDLLRYVAEQLGQAAATGELAALPAHAGWLFSLLMTAAKTTQVLGGSSAGGNTTACGGLLGPTGCYDAAAGICALAKHLASQCIEAHSTSSSGGSGQPESPNKKKIGKSKLSQDSSTGSNKTIGCDSQGSSSDSALWPVLAARCVLVMCQELEGTAAAGTVSCNAAPQQRSTASPTTGAASDAACTPPQLLSSLAAATSCLAAAAAPCSACPDACDGPGTICQTSVLSQASHMLGQELLAKVKDFAEQAFAALPLLNCCGNPACLSLQQRSEAQLVGGSRGRCSRCRACCYCSKGCQVAAWRLHKPVCRRLQEEAVREE
ncbi:hypothetical protein OEZ86_005116 [Tetradesmus obliquus]|nr:hypothetical protein OEZ86_005116 [Tetradesmus obliquus]